MVRKIHCATASFWDWRARPSPRLMLDSSSSYCEMSTTAGRSAAWALYRRSVLRRMVTPIR